MLEYLRASEQNEANGGKLFREVNVEADETFELEAYKAYDKAQDSVMKATDEQARSLAMTVISPTAVHQRVNQIKIKLRTMLSNSPELVKKVNNFLDDNIASERLTIATAMTEDIIALHEGRKFVWADSKEVFFNASQASVAVDELALWLQNDPEGRDYLKAISKKINDLNPKPKGKK